MKYSVTLVTDRFHKLELLLRYKRIILTQKSLRACSHEFFTNNLIHSMSVTFVSAFEAIHSAYRRQNVL